MEWSLEKKTSQEAERNSHLNIWATKIELFDKAMSLVHSEGNRKSSSFEEFQGNFYWQRLLRESLLPGRQRHWPNARTSRQYIMKWNRMTHASEAMNHRSPESVWILNLVCIKITAAWSNWRGGDFVRHQEDIMTWFTGGGHGSIKPYRSSGDMFCGTQYVHAPLWECPGISGRNQTLLMPGNCQ